MPTSEERIPERGDPDRVGDLFGEGHVRPETPDLTGLGEGGIDPTPMDERSPSSEERITLWRCPAHGLIQADMFDSDDQCDAGECPVPTYIEEPCRERLSPRIEVFPSSEIERLEGLVRDLTDPGECRFDHHGYCQEHGWMETDPPCPHARAKVALADDKKEEA